MTQVPEWQLRLAHDRAVRDAYVACGNPAPKLPDPVGGLYTVKIRFFDGVKFWASMGKQGHSSATFDECQCRR